MMFTCIYGYLYHALISADKQRPAYHLAAAAAFACVAVTMKMTPIIVIMLVAVWAYFKTEGRTRIVLCAAIPALTGTLLLAWYVYATSANRASMPYFAGPAFARFNYGTLFERVDPAYYWTIAKKSVRFLTPVPVILMAWRLAKTRPPFRFGPGEIVLGRRHTVVCHLVEHLGDERALSDDFRAAGSTYWRRDPVLDVPALGFIENCVDHTDSGIGRRPGVECLCNSGAVAGRPQESFLLKVAVESAAAAKAVVPNGEMVVNCEGLDDQYTSWNDPMFFYYAERLGINLRPVSVFQARAGELRREGYRWVVITYHADDKFLLAEPAGGDGNPWERR